MALQDAFAPPPSGAALPREGPPPLPIPAAIAHASMFLSLGWFLTQVPAFEAVFADLGAELPIPTATLMAVNHLLGSVGLPIWILAIVGLAADWGVWHALRRKGLHRAAENWLWIVAAAVIPTTVGVQQVLQLPMISLINSMK